MHKLLDPLLRRDHTGSTGAGMLHRLELHRPLELVPLKKLSQKTRQTLLGASSAQAGSPPTQHVHLLNALSNGRQVQLAGQLLKQALPGPDDVTALRTFFSRDRHSIGQLELERLEGGGMVLASVLTTDRTGAFSVQGTIAPPLPPGRYHLHWRNPGGTRLEGQSTLRVLPPDFVGPIITSDIDQTYLLTDVHSGRSILRLVREPAHQKIAFPGMGLLYRLLQGSGPDPLPTLFLSASPTFFGPVLAARLGLDGIHYDSLLLKHLDEVVYRELRRANLRGLKAAITDQLTYKLGTLLQQRLLYPIGAREILIGDDTEDDPVIFGLYRDVLSGVLGVDGLRSRLVALGTALAKQQRLIGLARAVWIHQQSAPARVDVYIRQHHLRPPPSEATSATTAPAEYFGDSLTLAKLLEARGDLSRAQVEEVAQAQMQES